MKEAEFVKSLTVALSIDVYQKIKEITDDEKIPWHNGFAGL
jgi:hypothetical protein